MLLEIIFIFISLYLVDSLSEAVIKTAQQQELIIRNSCHRIQLYNGHALKNVHPIWNQVCGALEQSESISIEQIIWTRHGRQGNKKDTLEIRTKSSNQPVLWAPDLPMLYLNYDDTGESQCFSIDMESPLFKNPFNNGLVSMDTPPDHNRYKCGYLYGMDIIKPEFNAGLILS
jgi:hypothetical protein